MLRRIIIIFFLFIQLACVYALLVLTKKRKRSWLVIPEFEKFGGTKTYFFSLIEFLSKKNFDITVMLRRDQCDDEVIALQNRYPFTIEEINFKLYKSSFAGTFFYKKKQEEFIYQLKEHLYFLKYFQKYSSSFN